MATRTRTTKPKSLTTADQPATVTSIRPPAKVKGQPMDFGTPVPVTDMPAASKRGGRVSNDDAYATWLSQLQPGATYELASTEDDGAHPVNRVTQIRKVVKEQFTGQFKIETRPVDPGKRYRIFATVAN